MSYYRPEHYLRRPLPPHPEDVARWRRFCAELPERIEAIRYEEAGTVCAACGSTTPEVIEKKACTNCTRVLPIKLFARNRTNRDGRQSWCRDCFRPMNRARMAAARKRRALEALAVAS